MTRTLRAIAAALPLIPASAAWAHPGHGTTDAGSPLHYLAEPLHAALALGAAVLAALLARAAWRARRR